jgi:hypothetical protein
LKEESRVVKLYLLSGYLPYTADKAIKAIDLLVKVAQKWLEK